MKYFVLFILLVSTVCAIEFRCGDSVCQDHENYISCPEDCAVAESTCNDAKDYICNPGCEEDPDCTQDAGLFVAACVFVVVFIAVLIFLFWRTTHHQEDYNVKNIDKFSQLKKPKEKTWSNMSEKEILEDIKNKDDRI